MIGWLLDTFAYTGALIALVLVLRRPVSRQFGPQIAYALWGLPFIRLLLPPIVLPASFAPKAAPTVSVVAGHASEPGTLLIIIDAPAPMISWPAVALLVWLGGALAFLTWRIVTYRWMREDLLEGARTVGEVGKIRLVETPAVDSPVAFGVRDKVVALPLLFMAQLDTAARDLAIAHELEHHRGRDLAANFAAQVLLALHWFNPLAWIGWRAMRRDQEAACDARVLAGRGREERARYAELIAGTAAGRRLALAAPMACPVLGDASIIHRLRSLKMTDISSRRRWLGRALVAGSALALPLTASISYAAANAQDVPTPPAPPAAAAPPPPAPQAPEAGERRVQRFVYRTERAGPRERNREVRRFDRRNGFSAPAPAPRIEMRTWTVPNDPEYQRRMQEWGRQMQEWGERYGQQWQDWAKQWESGNGRVVRQQRFALPRPVPAPGAVPAPVAPIAPLAPLAPVAPLAPQVIQNCDGNGSASSSVLPDGRRQVIICNRAIRGRALDSLRRARDRVAGDSRLSEDIRRQVLEDLDREIGNADRDGD